MGTVVRPPQRHARASSSLRAAKAAKTSNVISILPLLAAKATTAAQWPAGMPRVCQPDTVESHWPSASATAPVPPRATMIDFQSSMRSNIVRRVRTSQGFANCEPTFFPDCGPMDPMEPDSNEAVGNRIIALRKRAGLEQQQLAQQIHVTKSTLNAYERGKRVLTSESAKRLRRRFGVTVDWLFFGDMQVTGHDLMLQIGPEPEAEVPKKVRKVRT
jgi:DNA-binding XRE family transcriptional regulator